MSNNENQGAILLRLFINVINGERWFDLKSFFDDFHIANRKMYNVQRKMQRRISEKA